MLSIEGLVIAISTSPVKMASKPLNRAQQERKDHKKAYLSAVTSYERDPAYWFDLLCHTKGHGINKKFATKADEYLRKLRDLGWEVNFIGKSK